jgi:protein-S-isoprenylcysteine O-methyltransferase Ste14
MDDWLGGFRVLPGYGLGGLAVLLLYGLQSEVRFGAKARSSSAGPADRGSSLALSAAAMLVVAGFVVAMKAGSSWVPAWFGAWRMPGLPAAAWAGVAIGIAGLAVRLWSVLTLRERYTRTLLTHEQHAVERDGPYRWVRHPGYLGSLLALGGVALASGNPIVFFGSMLALVAAYGYRIRVEEEMLAAAFGESYAAYQREVPALFPGLR